MSSQHSAKIIPSPLQTRSHWSNFCEITEPSLYTAIEKAREGNTVTLWSPEEIIFLSKVNPVAIQQINSRCGASYQYNNEASIGQACALAESLFFTLDNSFFMGTADVGWLRSKVRGINNARQALGELPLLSETDVTENTLLDVAHTIKHDAIRILASFNSSFSSRQAPRAMLSSEHTRYLEDLFRDELVAVFMYGSSTAGAGKDIDLIVVVKSLALETYQRLGQEGQHYKKKSGQPLGIVLCPSDTLGSMARFDETQIMNGAIQQVWGAPLPLPFLKPQQVIEADLLKAGKSLISLRDLIVEPERLDLHYKTPKLLDASLKLELWIAKALEQVHQKRIMSKKEIIELISFPWAGIELPVGKPAIDDAIIKANVRTTKRIHTFVSAQTSPIPEPSF